MTWIEAYHGSCCREQNIIKFIMRSTSSTTTRTAMDLVARETHLRVRWHEPPLPSLPLDQLSSALDRFNRTHRYSLKTAFSWCEPIRQLQQQRFPQTMQQSDFPSHAHSRYSTGPRAPQQADQSLGITRSLSGIRRLRLDGTSIPRIENSLDRLLQCILLPFLVTTKTYLLTNQPWIQYTHSIIPQSHG